MKFTHEAREFTKIGFPNAAKLYYFYSENRFNLISKYDRCAAGGVVKKWEMNCIMCVGLACVDIVNIVDHFPKEDSDQR